MFMKKLALATLLENKSDDFDRAAIGRKLPKKY